MPLLIPALLIAFLSSTAGAQPRSGPGTSAAVAGSASELTVALNAARAKGCGGRAGAGNALQESQALARAARLVSNGLALTEALAQASYKANQSAGVSLQGPDKAPAVAAFLAQRYCQHLLRPEFSEVGSYRSGRQTWIVLAAPFMAPSVDDAADVARTVLQLVNQARGQAHRCGNQSMAAAPPVQLNDTLNAAALGHSRDMARNAYFDHIARDGSRPADRASRAGYRWRAIGENIAAGQNTPQDAMAGWLKSPGHCANLMRPEYKEMGIAFAVNKRAEQGIYWTQMFGTPR